MKTFLLFLFLTLSFFSCTATSDLRPFIESAVTTATQAAIAADTNADQKISNRELKDFTENPLLWLGMIGTLLGGGAYVTSRGQKKEIDELYDKTHKPITS